MYSAQGLELKLIKTVGIRLDGIKNKYNLSYLLPFLILNMLSFDLSNHK